MKSINALTTRQAIIAMLNAAGGEMQRHRLRVALQNRRDLDEVLDRMVLRRRELKEVYETTRVGTRPSFWLQLPRRRRRP